MKNIHAVLDFSGPGAVFAVKVDGAKIFEKARLMQRREAASMALFLQDALQEHGLGFDDVDEWTVGAGPGSFTGMRIACSLVQGLTFGKNVRSRTVPSAEAVALGAGCDSKKSCVIFDGRNKEIILLDLKSSQEAILNQAQAAEFFKHNKFDEICAMEYDRRAVSLIVPVEIADKIKWAEKLDTDAFFDSEKEFDNDLTKLIYIRPSVAGANE